MRSDFECVQTLSLCMMPVFGMDPQLVGQQIALNGLNEVCQYVSSIHMTIKA